MHELNNLVSKVSEQIPKVGITLVLTNLRLAINLVFDTIYQLLHLGLVITLIYCAYAFIPWSSIIQQLSK